VSLRVDDLRGQTMKSHCLSGKSKQAAAARRTASRRGGVTLWTILALPVLQLVLLLIVDGIHLWVARVELENALEAAALAAVKEWGDAGGGGSTLVPREIGVEYAAANTINGVPVSIATNYDAGQPPNENADCPGGDLIFGAAEQITGLPCLRYRFDAGAAAACLRAKVRINIIKPEAGAGNENSDPRYFGVFYEEGPPELSIMSVSITLPTGNGGLQQQPYFDASKNILASLGTPGPDGIPVPPSPYPWWNLDNPVPPNDIRGLTGADISFSLADQIICGPCGASRYGTLTVHYTPGTFQAPSDPNDSNTWEFMRYGASINQMNPPALPPGTQNNGEAFWQGQVGVRVVFYNSNTNTTTTATGTFVNNESDTDGYAYVQVGGGGGTGGVSPAVRAQASVPVSSLLCRFCGNVFGPYSVSACATAMYDCGEQRPRLIRIEPGEFVCP